MKRSLLAIPAVAALAVGASAFLMSPAACSCVDTVMELAAAAGLDHYKAHSHSPSQIEAGLNANLIGRKRTPHELFAPGLAWCDHTSQNVAECFVPTDESWILEKGLLVTFQTTAGGQLKHASVRQDLRLSSP